MSESAGATEQSSQQQSSQQAVIEQANINPNANNGIPPVSSPESQQEEIGTKSFADEGNMGGEIAQEPIQEDSLAGNNESNTSEFEWLNQIPEEFRDKKSFNKYNSFEDFIKGHNELASMLHKRMPTRPNENSTPEEINQWNSFVGAPENVTGYKLPESLKDPETGENLFEFSDEYTQEIMKEMHSVNMNQAQTDKAFEIFQREMLANEQGQQEISEEQQAREYRETGTELRKEWGKNFEVNLNTYQHLLKSFDIDSDVKAMGLDNNKAFINMIVSKIGGKLGNEASINGTLSVSNTKSFSDQKAEIMAMNGLSKKEKNMRVAQLYENRNKAIGRE
jgi:hypothetical protein